jgi:hypothetical protein
MPHVQGRNFYDMADEIIDRGEWQRLQLISTASLVRRFDTA